MTMDTEHLAAQVTEAISIGAIKRWHRNQRRAAKQEVKARRRRERRCFWTWPLRHEFVTVPATDGHAGHKRCVGCSAIRYNV